MEIMEIIHTAAGLAAHAGGILVPTMGALHPGHASLIREAGRRGAGQVPVVVSIFINPTQFGEPADLARYPRTLGADLAACAEAGAAVVFAPSVPEVYPPGQTVRIPPLPEAATQPGLEDAARPGHFAGVVQVVLRLFELARPRAAIFGEKDWQQLQVIAAMVHHERLPVQIIAAPTVREPDGLAMSSRNRFLTADDRRRARSLRRALDAAAAHGDPDAAEHAMRAVLTAAGVEIDYAVIRQARTLLPVRDASGPVRALVAGRIGAVRLIDNAPWPR
jgi:pantoate--beta-alanine ligase